MQEKKSIIDRFTLFIGSFLNFSKTIKGNLIVGLSLIFLSSPLFFLIIDQSPESLQSRISRYERRKNSIEKINPPRPKEWQIELEELSSDIDNLNQKKQRQEQFLKTPLGIMLNFFQVPLIAMYGLGGILFYVGVFRGIIFLVGYPFRKNTLAIEKIRLQGEIENLKAEIERTKKSPKRSWSRAQSILEKYYDRNLIQIQQIFYASVAVMIAGFILIALPVLYPRKYQSVLDLELIEESSKFDSNLNDSQNLNFRNSSQTNNSPIGISEKNFILLLTVISGMVTEFIGATFLVIYRSTINQSIKYTEALQRDNSVSMAMDILSDLEGANIEELEGETQKRVIDAKIAIATLLIGKNPDVILDIQQNKEKGVELKKN